MELCNCILFIYSISTATHLKPVTLATYKEFTLVKKKEKKGKFKTKASLYQQKYVYIWLLVKDMEVYGIWQNVKEED